MFSLPFQSMSRKFTGWLVCSSSFTSSITEFILNDESKIESYLNANISSSGERSKSPSLTSYSFMPLTRIFLRIEKSRNGILSPYSLMVWVRFIKSESFVKATWSSGFVMGMGSDVNASVTDGIKSNWPSENRESTLLNVSHSRRISARLALARANRKM